MKVLLLVANSKVNNFKDIKAITQRAKKFMTSFSETITIVENKECVKAGEYNLIVIIGFDFKILSSIFSILDKYKSSGISAPLVFLNPAGESFFDPYSKLITKCLDISNEPPLVIKATEDFWSLKNFEDYFKFKVKSLTAEP